MVSYKKEILCIVLLPGILSFNLQLLQILCHSSVISVDILFKELDDWNMNLGIRRRSRAASI